MPVLEYTVLKGSTIEHLVQLVNEALPAKQPYGDPVLDRETGMFCQAMVSTGGVVVTDGMTVDIEPSGSYVDTVTFSVTDGEITAIALS